MNRTDCLIRRIPRILAVVLPVLALLVMSTPALAAPIVTLSPTSAAIGTTVTITGINFESYRGDNISIFFDDAEITTSLLTIPQTGEFSVDFAIPDDAEPGRHWVSVRSEMGLMLAENFLIITETEIELNVVEGTVGTAVTINGKGFYAGKMVTFHYYNRAVEKLGTEIATATGDFSYPFTIPQSTAGSHRITTEDTEGNMAEAVFEVIPWVTLNLTSGATGDLLTASGNGFGYKSDITIYFGGKAVASTSTKTNDYGIFEVTFNVPAMRSQTYDVNAVDEAGNINKANFTITAGVELNKTTGFVGAEITVRGSGFKPSETVTVNYDLLQVATATTDKNGDFSLAFNVPLSNSGRHLVTVSDGTTSKQLFFTVESVPPPVPRPLLPVDTSETQSKAYLDWADVTDPSLPVTYSLQVASDRNFASIVVEKEGMTDSEYTLTEEEKLATAAEETYYYWRIKAEDGAINQSEWSTPWSFYIAAPPVPVLLLPETDIDEETQIHFDWEDVTSLNPPITYTLQIASDQSFTTIVLEKEELTDSEYTLTEEEELAAVKKEAPYYWRVKVIDSATNQSKWSAPRPFNVDLSLALPSWVTYLLIALGVIILGFLAFWIGRRTAFYQGDYDSDTD